MANRYVIKPVEVQAMLLTEHNAGTVAIWCGGAVVNGAEVWIASECGEIQARPGQYVVLGDNSIDASNADVFEERHTSIPDGVEARLLMIEKPWIVDTSTVTSHGRHARAISERAAIV